MSAFVFLVRWGVVDTGGSAAASVMATPTASIAALPPTAAAWQQAHGQHFAHGTLWGDAPHNAPANRDRLSAYQPHAIADAAYLYNRADLLAYFGYPRAEWDSVPDAELILQHHRAANPPPLRGDYAYAVWDAATQTITCARDGVGVIPLYYYHAPRRCFACSTDLNALLLLPDVPEELDEAAIAAELVRQRIGVYAARQTFFKGIYALAPAHELHVTPDSIRETRYWQPEHTPRLRYPHAADYAEHTRAVLLEAVTSRLAAPTPIGTHVSGGIDSSLILALAQPQLQAQGRTLQGYTWTNERTRAEAQAGDERYYIERLTQAFNVPLHHAPLSAAAYAYTWHLDIGTQREATLLAEMPTLLLAHQHGIQTLLSGWGGDQFISYNGASDHSDMLWRGRWGLLWRLLHIPADLRQGRWRRVRRKVWENLILPLLPNGVYRRLVPEPEGIRYFLFTNAAFLQRHHPQPTVWRKGRRRTIRAQMLTYLQEHFVLERLEAWYAAGARHGIHYTYPLLDSRVIELAFALPSDYLYRRGTLGRPLLRAALRGSLPDDYLDLLLKQQATIELDNEEAAYNEAFASLRAAVATDPAWHEAPPWLDHELLRAYFLGDVSRRNEWLGQSLQLGTTLRYRSLWLHHQRRRALKHGG